MPRFEPTVTPEEMKETQDNLQRAIANAEHQATPAPAPGAEQEARRIVEEITAIPRRVTDAMLLEYFLRYAAHVRRAEKEACARSVRHYLAVAVYAQYKQMKPTDVEAVTTLRRNLIRIYKAQAREIAAAIRAQK